MPPTAAASGSTIFGNWTCLMIFSRAITQVVASAIVLENHFQGRIAQKMNSGYASWLERRITLIRTT